MARNCTACGGRDVTESHAARCDRMHEERGAAVAHGAASQIPEVTTADLWAHLGHVGSFEDATRIVRQVVDLGWRPVVGSDARRLWSATPTDPGPDAPSPVSGPVAASTTGSSITSPTENRESA